uniref:ArnT family glycosyltransferase n=1 Tax=uncultured Sphingomonas sp. TaxID=158754 RepID=UPI0025DC2FC6|nr:hypothetical protein [uncultured Sphingomonas sp.]
MATAVIPSAWTFPARRLSPSTRMAIVLLVATLVLRAPRFGDPNLHVDEIFYLQVGDLMWNGALPFVDVWDRKPIGLFLLFGAIRLLGGDGIVQYQLVASGFAFGTAIVVAQLARRMGVSNLAAGAAGFIYLTGLAALGGYGGQSPVFYNLFVAGAALLTLRALDAPDRGGLTSAGVLAMALCGIAIQIKYTAVFEGCFFGALLAWRAWRAFGLAAAVRAAALFALCGIGPTGAAAAYYAAVGELQAFWFANFVSIGLRPPATPDQVHVRLTRIGLTLLPLLVCTVVAFAAVRWEGLRGGKLGTYHLVLGWLAVALGGFFLLGTYYWHYALPLLVPLSLAAAPFFERSLIGPASVLLVAFWNAVLIGYPDERPSTSRQQIAELTSAVSQNLNGRCLFMFDGPPAVDYLSGACHLTPYVFPYHLSLAVEETGLGVDPLTELRRILLARPGVIVSSSVPVMDPNRSARAFLYAVLARDYRLVGSYPAKRRHYQVYALRPKR